MKEIGNASREEQRRMDLEFIHSLILCVPKRMEAICRPTTDWKNEVLNYPLKIRNKQRKVVKSFPKVFMWSKLSISNVN